MLACRQCSDQKLDGGVGSWRGDQMLWMRETCAQGMLWSPHVRLRGVYFSAYYRLFAQPGEQEGMKAEDWKCDVCAREGGDGTHVLWCVIL